METGDFQTEEPGRAYAAPDTGASSIWQRAKVGLRKQVSSLRQCFQRFDETRGKELRRRTGEASQKIRNRTGAELNEFKADVGKLRNWRKPTITEENAPNFRERLKLRWKRVAIRARLIWIGTLLWTRRILAAIYFTAIIGGIAAIVFLAWWFTRPGDATEPGAVQSPDLSISTTLQCSGCEQLTVTGVIDGDTLDTSLGLVRIYGADTPERGESCFSEATDAMRQLAGETVRAQPGPRATDPFDRRLFYLYTVSGRSIDELLVRNGFAVAWTQDGQHRDLLVQLEREAAAADRGCLWR